MNKVCLVGRLTKDPTCEYVNTSNGSVARARFTIAVDAPSNANFDDVSPSDFSSDSKSSKSSTSSEEGASVWDAGSNIEIDPDELPFY